MLAEAARLGKMGGASRGPVAHCAGLPSRRARPRIRAQIEQEEKLAPAAVVEAREQLC